MIRFSELWVNWIGIKNISELFSSINMRGKLSNTEYAPNMKHHNIFVRMDALINYHVEYVPRCLVTKYYDKVTKFYW